MSNEELDLLLSLTRNGRGKKKLPHPFPNASLTS